MFNFRSLAAMVGDADKKRSEADGEHIEHAAEVPTASSALADGASKTETEPEKRDASVSLPLLAEDTKSASPAAAPVTAGAEQESARAEGTKTDVDQITAAPVGIVHSDVVDSKEHGSVNVLDHGHVHEATQ